MKKKSSPLSSKIKVKQALLADTHGYEPKSIHVGAVSQVLATRAGELVNIAKKVSKHTGSGDIAIADESDVFHVLKVSMKNGKLSSVDVVLRSFPARNHGEIAGFKSVQLKERVIVGRKRRDEESRKKTSRI